MPQSHLPSDPTTRPRASAVTWLVRALLLVVGYVLSAIALVSSPFAESSALIWPPIGVALGALVRYGPGLWPAAGLGACLLALAGGASAGLALLLAIGAALGPALGAWWIRRRAAEPDGGLRRGAWCDGALGGGLAVLLSTLNTALWAGLGGSIAWVDLPSASARWAAGAALGAVIVGVPLASASRAAWQQAFGTAGRRRASSLLVLGTLAGAVLAAAFAGGGSLLQSPFFFLPHLMLCWLAWRSGLFAAACVASVVAVGSALLMADHAGPAALLAGGSTVWLLCGYLASLLATPLLTGALYRELRAREHRWQFALDLSQTGTADWRVARGQVALSAHWLSLLGLAASDFGGTLDDLCALIHPEDVEAARAALQSVQAGTDARAECRMRRGDGGWRLFELHAAAVERDGAGAPLRILIAARDIGELQAARARQDLSQSVFQNLHEGLLITDPQHRVIEANPTFCRITGYAREELLGQIPPMLLPRSGDEDLIAQLRAMQTGLELQGSWSGELRHRRRDGKPCLLQLAISAVRSADGTVLNHVLAITDITHAREQLEQLERQAHFDELTRLPNRVRLAQMLQTAMATSRREGSLLTVCYLDLDHFKPVNDQFGHEAGDRLLVELANRMRRSLRSWAGGDDVVARIGGDEFVLLLRTATVEESLHAVERVLTQICVPYAVGLGVGPVKVTASIGATVFPLDGADAETLLRHADRAMYDVKQSGRNGYLFFDPEHDRRTEARFVALVRVQEAIDAEEFRLYFQPKVDLRTSLVLGVEALLRWKHPEHGLKTPAQFLPLIENTDLSIDVGNWVMQRGIEQLAQWLRMGLDMTVSINVSARHLQSPLFAQHLRGLLARQQAPVAGHLIIEVLETAALADIDYTCRLMEECRTLGVRFALDDFGTGYSSFTYLKRLPIDMLKIDRSFVINMLADHEDLAIVEGVVGLSQTFGCAIVAEGVETFAQAQRLIEIGCTIGQGNGIAAAMPADQVVDWVQAYRGMPAAPPAVLSA